MPKVNFVYKIAKGICSSVFSILFGIEVHGKANVPAKGAFILASNHVSYFDPPATGCLLPRDLYYFARKTLFKPGFASWLLHNINTIPVDRDGDSDVSAFKRVFKVLKSGEGLTLFPEGTRSPDGTLQKAQRGVGLIACKTQVPVVPTRVYGAFEALKRGSKLPNLQARMHIVYGPTLYPKDYDPGKSDPDRYQTASNRIMEAIAALEKPEAPQI
tara:strand:+ start:45937 stop:46581 length:645 start_codon:yes stop_codon:yes gene_type:complete